MNDRPFVIDAETSASDADGQGSSVAILGWLYRLFSLLS